VVITNTKRERKSISVIKQWLDKAGNAIEKATGSINVKLCRKAVENKTVLITPQIIETSQLTDKSSTNRFAVGSRVKLLVYVGFNTSSWQPDISIQGATEVTSESGWNIDGTGIYTYVFDVDSSTKSITGTVTSRYYSDAYVELVLVSGPESTDDAEVLAVDTIGEYTITADEDWSKSIDITNLDSTGVYKKSDGTVADVSYIYYIEEADVNGYSVTYDGESSPTEFDVEKISDGCSTTIVNKATGESVTLPSTGGTGTKVYTIGGALMMICAACCLYIKNKKSKGESLI
jgi:LPXTG-motif cell wall-anchored protein